MAERIITKKGTTFLAKKDTQRFVWDYLDDHNYYKDFHDFLLTKAGKEALGVANIFAIKRTDGRLKLANQRNTSFGTLTDLEKEMLRYHKSQFYNREELRRHRAFPSRIREEISNTETKAILYNRFRDAASNFRPGRLGQTAIKASEHAGLELYGIGRNMHIEKTGHPLYPMKDFDPTVIERYNQHKNQHEKYSSSDSLEERIEMGLLKKSTIYPRPLWFANPLFAKSYDYDWEGNGWEEDESKVDEPTERKNNPYFSYNK
jgi:hypothetical protein